MSKQSVSILLADSDLSDIDIIKSNLSAYDDINFNFDTARSDTDTLDKVEGKKFDLVLMNQDPPGINGIKMLKEISERKLGMPVIMIVAVGEEKLGVEAMDKGAYDYLTREEIKNQSLNRAVYRAIQRKKLENDIKESLVKLEKLAIRDGLTGLYNQFHLREVIKNEFKKAKRHLQPMSCMMLDLDHFKSVNDSHGHQFGDFVLAQSAGILKSIVRDTDFVARYGGEEFFVILPSTNLKGSFILAERIRVAFANNVFKKDNISELVTVSIGISSTTDNNVLNDEDLIANADKSLYRAKWRGRNNVCTFEEAEVEEAITIREEFQKMEDFYSRLRNINENIKENCIESTHDILREIEKGWDYINEHSIRVSRYTEKLTRELLMAGEDINIVKRAALLHDIGMIGINSDILRKRDKLTTIEYNAIKRHSNIGVKIMEKTKLFEKELPIILYHHERFDGSGYPHRLKGDTIPYGARILAVAEAYDVMMSNTDYKKAVSPENAIAELKECAGTQFDPHIVDTFVKIVD
ncbi:MAG: diguanylate cyclase, partial [Thermodesulfovibrionia bacterium]|nr:diguanylate cyclase [Thermodesulfovibrionia bacterium]